MSRWVIPGRKSGEIVAETRGPGGPSDKYDGDGVVTRIAKYVPAEIITAYTMLFAVLASIGVQGTTALYSAGGLILLFLGVTVLYVRKYSPADVVRKAHIVVSPVAFLVWAYPISSSLLGELFVPLVAFGGQAVVIALSFFIKPVE